MTHTTTTAPARFRLVPEIATRDQLETAGHNLSADIGSEAALALGAHIALAYQHLVAAAPRTTEVDMIQRLRLEEGDLIVISTAEKLSRDHGQRFADWLREAVGRAGGPADVPVIFLDDGMTLNLLATRKRSALAEDMVPLLDPQGREIGRIARSSAEEVFGGAPLSFSIEGITGRPMHMNAEPRDGCAAAPELDLDAKP